MRQRVIIREKDVKLFMQNMNFIKGLQIYTLTKMSGILK